MSLFKDKIKYKIDNGDEVKRNATQLNLKKKTKKQKST
jgi:hypothetical protein